MLSFKSYEMSEVVILYKENNKINKNYKCLNSQNYFTLVRHNICLTKVWKLNNCSIMMPIKSSNI